MLMMPKVIWSFDPGGTTGYAKFVRTNPSERYLLVETGGIVFLRPIIDQIWPAHVVVMERLTALHPSFNTIGIEAMGILKYACECLAIVPVMQQPGVCKAVQEWKLYNFKQFKTQHEKDAVAHGIAYIGRDNVIIPETSDT